MRSPTLAKLFDVDPADCPGARSCDGRNEGN